MKFFANVKAWFIAHKPTKRKIIQLYAALLTNAHIAGFFTGEIYTGETKKACVPGLNCYSCPGAVGACPLGALQDSMSHSDTTVPAYIFGILILFGLMLGRAICAFLCPFGLIQELLHKIPTPKLKKNKYTRVLSYFKYFLLILVIALPFIFAGIPAFCQYICPAGTFEGAIFLLLHPSNASFFEQLGPLFVWKFSVMVSMLVASVFIYRVFCRFFCPLGAIYSLFNRFSLLGVKLDKNECIDCGICIQGCKMDVKHVGDHECIMCGECIKTCPVKAISWKGSKIFLRPTSPLAQPAVAGAETEGVSLLDIAKNSAEMQVPQGEYQSSTAQAETEDAADLEVSGQAVAEEVLSEDVTATEEGEEQEPKSNEETAGNAPVKSGKGAAIKAAFKKPRFVVEFIAWVLATCLLIAALVCYNLPEKEKEKLPDMTFATYQSAAVEGGQNYTVESTDDKVKLIYFWRTDMEEGHQLIEKLPGIKDKFSRYMDIEVLAVHTTYDGTLDVQAFIDSKGWNTYDVIFAQDLEEVNEYAKLGGDIAEPQPIAVVMKPDGTVTATPKGEVTESDLTAGLIATQKGNVYGVGDKCPYVELNSYCNKDDFNTTNNLGRVTVINFWYTGCNPCKAELPAFNRVKIEYGDRINMYAVHNYNSIPSKGVQNWLDNNSDVNGLTWGNYSLTYAQDTEEIDFYRMLGGRASFPTTIVVDATGIITYVCSGECSEQNLVNAIEQAMNS